MARSAAHIEPYHFQVSPSFLTFSSKVLMMVLSMSEIPEARRDGGVNALWASSADCVVVNESWFPELSTRLPSTLYIFREPTFASDHTVVCLLSLPKVSSGVHPFLPF